MHNIDCSPFLDLLIASAALAFYLLPFVIVVAAPFVLAMRKGAR